MKKIKFYLDFDGTITQTDVVDMVLERFADPSWKDIEEEWAEEKIGSRECLSRQIALVRATPQDIKDLCGEVRLSGGFVSFLQTTQKLDIPVKIVSDGFELIIRTILEKQLGADAGLLHKVPVYSNRIEWDGGKPKAVFLSEDPCRHGCANCKPEVIKNTAWFDDTIIFVGDGHSDRHASEICNLTFAKDNLLEFCRQNYIDHEPFTDFGDIEAWLVKNYQSLKSAYDTKLSK